MSRSEKEKTFDFGFSLVDEDELKAYERDLEKQKEEVVAQAKTSQEKFDDLYEMVMVLLKNLSDQPKKSYIYWPNRIEKVQEFIRRINDLRDN
jgi:hypothetical protein